MNNAHEWVTALRDTADRIERGDRVDISVFEYNAITYDQNLGGMAVDVKWCGRSIVMHVGAIDGGEFQYPNNNVLLMRLQEERDRQ